MKKRIKNHRKRLFPDNHVKSKYLIIAVFSALLSKVKSDNALIVFIILLIINSSLLFLHTQPSLIKKLPGEAVPVLPALKIERGEKHDPYLTIPASSGWYYDSDSRSGIYSSFIPEEEVVGKLIKGVVAIEYNCQYKAEPPSLSTNNTNVGLNQEEQEQTKAEAELIWNSFKNQNTTCARMVSELRKIVENKDQNLFILVPNPKLDSRIATVAWGRIDKMLWPDKERINSFLDAYMGKVPKNLHYK